MPNMGHYMPKPRPTSEEEPVEDFRQTFSMKNFSQVYRRILGVADFLKQSLGAAMAEADRRRNLYGQAVGSLLNFQNRAPRLQSRMYEVAGQMPDEGLPEEFGPASEEHIRRATSRVEESPFSAYDIATTLGERGQITEKAFKMRK